MHRTGSKRHKVAIVYAVTFLLSFASQIHSVNADIFDWFNEFWEEEPRTVLVTFEIQTINADATSYGYGITGGQGTMGFGAVNEIIGDSFYANVGQEVFAKAYGTHWDRSDPGHQIICRIIVQGEEIYIDGDQGTPDQDTEVICQGPVYIPQRDNND